jgi:alkylhydroperoxidase domain protein
MSDKIVTHPGNAAPKAFTQAQLDWLPWLEPPTEESLSVDQQEALIDRARAKSAYFRLLASDPAILKARTLTDKDIFYNPDSGLPRAERELAAAAVSRVNGCIYCASVHARFSTTYSKRGEDVDRLLAEGVKANLDDRWNAIVAASVALTNSPVAFGKHEIEALHEAGLDDLAISDAIHAAAFFNWANRLMLTLGEPALSPVA